MHGDAVLWMSALRPSTGSMFAVLCRFPHARSEGVVARPGAILQPGSGPPGDRRTVPPIVHFGTRRAFPPQLPGLECTRRTDTAGMSTRRSDPMSIVASPLHEPTPVTMYKAAGDALRRQDRVAADTLILALRAFGADGPAHAGFYADVLDARLAMAVDDVDAAIRHLDGARARLAETPATEHAQMALAHAESRMLLATMRPADALHVLEEAWALRDAVDDPRLCLACALMICHCFKRLERWSDAEPWQDIAIAMARQQGWRAQVFELQTEAAGAFLEEGDHLARQGRLEQAQDRWRAAASTFDALVSDPCFGELRPYNRVVFLCDHASSLSRVGRGAEALPLVERCFELSAGFVDHDLRIALHLAKANVLRDLQRLDEATAEAGLGGQPGAAAQGAASSLRSLHAAVDPCRTPGRPGGGAGSPARVHPDARGPCLRGGAEALGRLGGEVADAARAERCGAGPGAGGEHGTRSSGRWTHRPGQPPQVRPSSRRGACRGAHAPCAAVRGDAGCRPLQARQRHLRAWRG
jgi:tetratricopeptide (TPR) repeat protein